MFSATKFIVVAVVVALFGGFLLAGTLSTRPNTEQMPAVGASASAAVGTAEPASSTAPGPPASPRTTHEVYEATATLRVDPGPEASEQDYAEARAAV